MSTSQQNTNLALQLEGVTFSYEKAEHAALNNISLEIERGTCVVLTGKSGCGKTTLTRLINGLIPVVYQGEIEGSVSVLGKNINDWSIEELAGSVGSVFQNPRSQFVNLDTTSEIAFGCETLGLPQQDIVSRVKEAAELLGITELLDHSVEMLSGGQKQLVILASVCAVHPDILVLDEPTASLDAHAMRRLGKAIATLKEQGKTIIVSEHRLWWLQDIADRVVHIEDGRKRGDWTSSEFAALSPQERADWGLRAWDIQEVGKELFASHELEQQESKDELEQAQEGTVPSVCAEELQVGYRKAPKIINDLNLALYPGQAVALVGKNGAGKTTLARCLTGLAKEQEGTVYVEGQKTSYKNRAGLVYLVMQEPGYQLFSNTVKGELEESLTRRKQTSQELDKQASAMMQQLGLESLSERHPLSLSGGERQRLSIGAGLLYGAGAIVMDEPTSGLDYTNMAKVAAQVKEIKNQGRGVCIITHDFEFLCESCDAFAVLEGGKIAELHPLTEETLPQLKKEFGFR